MLNPRVLGSGLMELPGALKTGRQGNPITIPPETKGILEQLTTMVWACGMMKMKLVLGHSFANMILVSLNENKQGRHDL